MRDRKTVSKSALAVSVALLFVLLLVIGAFVFAKPNSERVEILLPEPQAEPSDTESGDDLQGNGLLQIDPENTVTALRSLERPDYYHQIYSVYVGKNALSAERTVELWVNGSLVRAQVTSDRGTKTVLTDRTSAWVWYDSNTAPRKFTLSDDLMLEDIIGLPTFDYLQTLDHAEITEAEYLVLENDQNQTPSIFVSAKEYEGALSRYWIDLNTGLLRNADCMENNAQVYRVVQTAFDRLVNGDEAFSDKFLLPDGTSIATEGTNMQQP